MSDRILPEQLQEQRAGVIARTAVIGGLINPGLAATKVGAGVLWHSQALVADGIHSLSVNTGLEAEHLGRDQKDHRLRRWGTEYPYAADAKARLAGVGGCPYSGRSQAECFGGTHDRSAGGEPA